MTDNPDRWSTLMKAATPAPPMDIDPLDLMTPAEGRRRGSALLAPIGITVAIVAVAVTVAVATHRASDRSAGTADTPSQRLVSTPLPDRLTLSHPAGWRYVPVEQLGAGFGSTIGYFTTEPPSSQCATVAAGQQIASSCRPPVTRLRRSGVFVDVYAIHTGNPVIAEPNATFAGEPARIDRSTRPERTCPSGTDVSITAKSAATKPGTYGFVVTTCIAGPSTAPAEAATYAMLKSAATTK